MARFSVNDIRDTVRESLEGLGDRGHDLVDIVTERVEDALQSAGKSGRRAGKELRRRWKTVDRAGRDNPFFMAIGALGIGLLIGYLISRDKDES